jgi:hypothetical protein
MLSSLDTGSRPIVFCRRPTTLGRAALGDVLFTRQRSHGSEYLSVRIHAEILKRLNWLAGDSVVVVRRREPGLWSVERVAAGRGGIKLRVANKKRKGPGHVSARFSADSSCLDEAFAEGEKSWTASLIEAEGNVAVFCKD